MSLIDDRRILLRISENTRNARAQRHSLASFSDCARWHSQLDGFLQYVADQQRTTLAERGALSTKLVARWRSWWGSSPLAKLLEISSALAATVLVAFHWCYLSVIAALLGARQRAITAVRGLVPADRAQRDELLRVLESRNAAFLSRAHRADERRRSARAGAQFARALVGRSRGAGARFARASLDMSRLSAEQAHANEMNKLRMAAAEVEVEARWLRALR